MHWLDINENAYKYLRLQKIKKKDLKLPFFFFRSFAIFETNAEINIFSSGR